MIIQSVILDVCSLDQELTLLQQGCDITGGNYLKVPQLNGLLQYLLVCFNFYIKFIIKNNIMEQLFYFFSGSFYQILVLDQN